MAHPLRAVDSPLADRVAAVGRDRFREVGHALLKPLLQNVGALHENDSPLARAYTIASNGGDLDDEQIRVVWEAAEAAERDAAANRAAFNGQVHAEDFAPSTDQVVHSAQRAWLLRAFASLYTAEHQDRLLDVVWHARNGGADAEQISALLASNGA